MSRVRHLSFALALHFIGSDYHPPIREYEETVVLCPVHSAHHSCLIRVADLDSLQNVIWTCKPLQPDHPVELDLSPLLQLCQGLQCQIPHVCLLERVISGRGVLCHRWHPSNPKRNPEQRQDCFAEVRKGLGGVGGVVVKHGNEQIGGAEAFGHLDDDGKLVDEEVVGAVDDDSDVIEVVFANEVFIGIFALVLAKGTGESRAQSGHPAIERQ